MESPGGRQGQRRGEEWELEGGERQFRTLAESIPQLAWMADPDGYIFWYNRRWYDYTGTTFEQMEGWGWQSVHDPDELPRVLERWTASIATGEPFDMVFPLKGGDGTFRPFLTRVMPVLDGEGRVARWVGTNTDVTETKQAEERERRLLAEAAAANAKFRAFFEQGALFAGIMDLDGTILEPNRLSWEGCGYTREQIIGKPFWECPWWTPSADLVEKIRAASARAAAGETFRAEMPYFVADGSERMVDLILLPVRDEAGRVLFLAPTGTDITHRRRLEDELRLLAADLSAADRRKDEFLATLAHELRNPLAPIRNGLQILKLAGHDGKAVEQIRTMMERQLTQMVRLVDDLLDVSRITRNRLELRRERVELAAVVTNAVETSRPLIDAGGHQLTVSLPPEPVFVDADVTRLGQVFANLLNNAAKYSERGGRIRLTAERQGGEVVVSVEDEGIGIPPHMLSEVFDLFTQVDRSLERSQGGLGIGLTLVKRLVGMHGGSVEARSGGHGTGSELVVRLPVSSSS
jgi:PAS domain S-box-containing protein